jgi:APA family basic amino acid/polyamine antiporter
MATALAAVGQPWAAGLVSCGALAGLTSVIMVLLLGQSRILFAMSRDRLLPRWFARVHPRLQTPYRATLLTGGCVALIAAVTPIAEIAELVNIGTLLAFLLVSVSVLVLRYTRPELQRPFRIPLVPLIPVASALICLGLMANLPVVTWLRFGVWLLIGLAIYCLYGYRASRSTAGAWSAAENRQSMSDSVAALVDANSRTSRAIATRAESRLVGQTCRAT